MDRITGVQLFVRIVETGSFSKASVDLGVTQPTATKHVAAVEARLGARLLNRNTRGVSATEIGALYPHSFDRILLDAPCTGLGALRRRPEARWRKQPSDVAGLGNLQVKLLRSAIAALKPGGILAYVTCSPHAAETKAIVTSVLRKSDDMERMNTPAVVQSIVNEPLDLPEATHVQLWPHRHGTDGMFIQLLSKAYGSKA